ncbi:MAG: pyridoxal phosphate-dependent aminotransferase [Pseudomonadota bacterium]
MSVKINPIVAALPDTVPFVAPEEVERARGTAFQARLGANEGNFGAAPAAVEAMARAAQDDVWKYCDPTAFHLREALAEPLGIPLDALVCGPGIDGLLGLIVRIFSEPGDRIVSSLGAYPTFNYHVHAYGRQLVTVPYRTYHEDLEALAAKASDVGASMIYVSNPDNPMGTWWDGDAIAAFVEAVDPNILIILDEAYGETAPAGTLPPIDLDRRNLIRLRTFSKAYGLAGLRVGYAFGAPALIGLFNRVRDHFGVNIMAQVAARAALSSSDWLAQTVQQIADGREAIAAIAQSNGLEPIASATNFVTIDCGGDKGHAERLVAGLAERQIFVRKPMAPGLDHCIRVSVGRPEEIDLLAAQLPHLL